MAKSDAFSRLHERARSRPSYWEGLIKMRFANDLGELLESEDVSQADLARQIRKSPQYVSKVLSGDQNLTIGTMVKLLWAFDRVPRIEAVAKEAFYAAAEPVFSLEPAFVGDFNFGFAPNADVITEYDATSRFPSMIFQSLDCDRLNIPKRVDASTVQDKPEKQQGVAA